MAEYTTLQLVQREAARILNVERVDPDIGIVELGIDSLNVVELILTFERLYQRPIQPEMLSVDQFTTLRQLDRQILELSCPATNSSQSLATG